MATRQRAFAVRNYSEIHTLTLWNYIEDVKNPCTAYANEVIEDGWKIVATDNRAGRCYYPPVKHIAIPVWVIQSTIEMMHYYLAHELAHIKAGYDAGHGLAFMAEFKKLCNKEQWHYEFDYKPSAALFSGILPEDF